MGKVALVVVGWLAVGWLAVVLHRLSRPSRRVEGRRAAFLRVGRGSREPDHREARNKAVCRAALSKVPQHKAARSKADRDKLTPPRRASLWLPARLQLLASPQLHANP